MLTAPASKGMRDLPFVMSRASATRTMPASTVMGLPSLLWEMMACRVSERMIVRGPAS